MSAKAHSEVKPPEAIRLAELEAVEALMEVDADVAERLGLSVEQAKALFSAATSIIFEKARLRSRLEAPQSAGSRGEGQPDRPQAAEGKKAREERIAEEEEWLRQEEAREDIERSISVRVRMYLADTHDLLGGSRDESSEVRWARQDQLARDAINFLTQEAAGDTRVALGWLRSDDDPIFPFRTAGLRKFREERGRKLDSGQPQGYEGTKQPDEPPVSEPEEQKPRLLYARDAAGGVGLPIDVLLAGVRGGAVPVDGEAAERFAAAYKHLQKGHGTKETLIHKLGLSEDEAQLVTQARDNYMASGERSAAWIETHRDQRNAKMREVMRRRRAEAKAAKEETAPQP